MWCLVQNIDRGLRSQFPLEVLLSRGTASTSEANFLVASGSDHVSRTSLQSFREVNETFGNLLGVVSQQKTSLRVKKGVFPFHRLIMALILLFLSI